MTVARARKIQRFLSQPFHVAEVFTGSPGNPPPLRPIHRLPHSFEQNMQQTSPMVCTNAGNSTCCQGKALKFVDVQWVLNVS